MRFSVEFAHANLAAVDKDDLDRSIDVARTVVASLRSLGHEVITAVLFDDKTVGPGEAEGRAMAVLEHLAHQDLPADHWYMETQLRHLQPDLGRILPMRARKKLDHDANGYLERYGNLPCSVDIALWHTFRLGLLDGGAVESADIAVSVLSDGNREYEELATEHFLKFLEPRELQSRIIPLYYPQSPAAPLNLVEILSNLELAIKEAPQCPVS